jgi:hypothetical protein
MSRFDCLVMAREAVTARADHYGTPESNFERIAALWSVVLERPVTAEQVALCLGQVKVARLIQTPQHRDSWVDLAGYAACGFEVSQRCDNACERAAA